MLHCRTRLWPSSSSCVSSVRGVFTVCLTLTIGYVNRQAVTGAGESYNSFFYLYFLFSHLHFPRFRLSRECVMSCRLTPTSFMSGLPPPLVHQSTLPVPNSRGRCPTLYARMSSLAQTVRDRARVRLQFSLFKKKYILDGKDFPETLTIKNQFKRKKKTSFGS